MLASLSALRLYVVFEVQRAGDPFVPWVRALPRLGIAARLGRVLQRPAGRAALVAMWPFKSKKPPLPPPPLAYSWSGDGVGRPEPTKSHAWIWAIVVVFLLILLLAWVVPALAAPVLM
jgi:hypothetical protein